MKKNNYRISVFSVIVLLNYVFLGSCASHKKIAYFKDISDSTISKIIQLTQYEKPIIKPNDLLQITIQTLDPSSNLLAAPGASANALGASITNTGSSVITAQAPSVLVDENGMIELPLVGKVKVGGMTTTEARDFIAEKTSTYYKNPIVDVKFTNFNISVLGQVNKPGQYIVPNEKVSILDAITLASDLTIFGKRTNVLLIRNDNNEKIFVRFDLTSSDIFKSPYFYLKQGDVIYIEPNKTLVANTDAAATQRITLAVSVLSLLVVLFSTLKK